MFKSSNPFDSQDLVEVTSFISIVTIKLMQLQPGVSLIQEYNWFSQAGKTFELK